MMGGQEEDDAGLSYMFLLVVCTANIKGLQLKIRFFHAMYKELHPKHAEMNPERCHSTHD